MQIDLTKLSPETRKTLGKAKKASEDIEAIFVKQLISEMRKSAGKGMFGDGLQAQMYADFLDEAIAKQMSHGEGIGLGKQLYSKMEQQLLKNVAVIGEEKNTTKPTVVGKESNP